MAARKSFKKVLVEYINLHINEWILSSKLSALATEYGVDDAKRPIRSIYNRNQYCTKKIDNKQQYIFYERLDPNNIPSRRPPISAKLRALVLNRDKGRCQLCGKTINDDHIKLHIDHVIPVEWGGETELTNLQSLCEQCNLGKKDWVNSESPDLMIEVQRQSSAEKRLKVYFEKYPNKDLDVNDLEAIAGTRDWPRALRNLRPNYTMVIKYIRRNRKKNITYDGYMYIPSDTNDCATNNQKSSKSTACCS